MDSLRGLAILLVLVLHSATALPMAGIEPQSWLLDLSRVFVLFRMPTLVFLSGLLLSASLNKPVGTYLYGKLQRIGWPLGIWSIIYLVVFPLDFTIGQFIDLLRGDSYLWFLSFILLYYLSAILLRHVPAILVSATLLTLAMAAPDGAKYSERLLYLGALFYLGAWVGSRRQEWVALITSRWAPGALVLASYFAMVMFPSPQTNYGPSDLFAACCFIVGAAAVAYKIQGSRHLRPVCFVGEHSLQFYVMHFPIMYAFARVCSWLGLTNSALISLTSIPLALALSALVVMSAKQLPALQLLFVGPRLPERLQRAMGIALQ